MAKNVTLDSLSNYNGIKTVWSQRDQSISGNTSVLRATITQYSTAWASYAATTLTLKADGQTKTVAVSAFNWSGANSRSLGYVEFTITHASNGVKSASISHSWDLPIATQSKSGTFSFDTIPRTSDFTAPNDFTMGEDFTVNITPASSGFRHKVELLNGSTVLYASANNVTTSNDVSVSWGTMGLTCTNAMSKNYVIRVTTYNGSTTIGSKTRNTKGWVPNNIRPSFEHLNAAETVTEVSSKINAFVQGKSRVKMIIANAKAGYGSWITNYKITGYGINHSSSSANEGTSSILYSSGTHTYTATVTDARGQTYTWTRDIEVLPYTPPTLSGLSFRRTLPDKTEAPLGNNVTVRANVKVQSLIVDGVEKNSIWYQVQSAKIGSTFESKLDTTDSDVTKNYSDVWSGYLVDFSYNFRVRMGDIFGWGSWFAGVVPTGIVTQQWGSKTTSFGKMIDDTSYNVQVGTGGVQTDGPIIDKSGNEVFGINSMFHKIIDTTPAGAGWENAKNIVVPPHFSGKFEVLDAKVKNANDVWLDANAYVRPNNVRTLITIEVPVIAINLEIRIIIMKI